MFLKYSKYELPFNLDLEMRWHKLFYSGNFRITICYFLTHHQIYDFRDCVWVFLIFCSQDQLKVVNVILALR